MKTGIKKCWSNFFTAKLKVTSTTATDGESNDELHRREVKRLIKNLCAANEDVDEVFSSANNVVVLNIPKTFVVELETLRRWG